MHSEPALTPSASPLTLQPVAEARPLNEAREDWERVLSKCSYVPVAYTPEMIQYQSAYMQPAGSTELSMVLYNDRLPVGVWPLSVHRSEDGWTLASQEASVRPPLFADHIGENTRKTLVDRCLGYLEGFSQQWGIEYWESKTSPRGASVDIWHRRIMEKGATASLTHELWIDLSLPLPAIQANVRKSFRPLISKGLKLWKPSFAFGTISAEEFEEFRQLHIQVAGRETRSAHTWNIQREMIANRKAFLVSLRDQENTLMGGGLFHLSSTEAFYGVGVYRRDLFDLPLGHLVQAKAIEHLKEIGLKWYFLGARPYPADLPSPGKKDLSIAHFKEGFATNHFLGVKTICPFGAVPT